MGDDDAEAMTLVDGIPMPLRVSRLADPTGRRDEPAADEAAIEARVAQVCDDILAGRVAPRQIFALETALQRLRLNLMLGRAIRRTP
ncbi:MAG: hypothetical protein ACJ8AI_34770 [Rhodopila sp.]